MRLPVRPKLLYLALGQRVVVDRFDRPVSFDGHNLHRLPRGRLVRGGSTWYVVRGTWFTRTAVPSDKRGKKKKKMMMNSKLATGGIGSIHFALPVRDWPRWPRCIM